VFTIIFDGQIVNSSQAIELIKDFKSNQTYQIVCAAVNAKPNVNLTLYDTTSMRSLSTSSNSLVQESCGAYDLCTDILQVNFQFQDNSFDNMTSLTCSANSSDLDVPLNSKTSRNVTIKAPSLLLFIIIIILFEPESDLFFNQYFFV
jgi:hypothetical protein